MDIPRRGSNEWSGANTTREIICNSLNSTLQASLSELVKCGRHPAGERTAQACANACSRQLTARFGSSQQSDFVQSQFSRVVTCGIDFYDRMARLQRQTADGPEYLPQPIQAHLSSIC